MTDSPESPQHRDALNQLSALEVRRTAVARLVNIAHTLEWLRQGLESVVRLNDAPEDFPASILQLYDALGHKMRNLSDTEVTLRLERLDKKVNLNLKAITTTVAKLERMPLLTGLDEKIDTFRRLSQTAVALRVLLTRRGQKVAPLKLALPIARLKKSLHSVKREEQAARQRVVEEIIEFERELQQLQALETPDSPMQNMIEDVLQDLAANREHLILGGSIQALPVQMDAIDLGSDTALEVPQEAASTPATVTESADSHIESATNHPREGSAPQPTAKTEKNEPTAPSKSIWRRFLYWLNTPWNVSWRDISKINK
ncbi:MAG: hypothetical protein P8Y42_11755 [Exilibacterium sp.]